MDDIGWFDQIHAEYIARRAAVAAQVAIGSEWINASGDFCGVVSADHQELGRVRLTLFDAKGPWGHRTRDTLADLVQVIMDDLGHGARLAPGCVDRMTGGTDAAGV